MYLKKRYAIFVIGIFVIVFWAYSIGHSQDNVKETWEYAILVRHWELVIQVSTLGGRLNTKEFSSYDWHEGGKFYTADNLSDLIKAVGWVNCKVSTETISLLNYLGGLGWEMFDYNYHFDRERNPSSNAEIREQRYLFKRRI